MGWMRCVPAVRDVVVVVVVVAAAAAAVAAVAASASAAAVFAAAAAAAPPPRSIIPNATLSESLLVDPSVRVSPSQSESL